jgi:plastocyanin
MQNILSDRRLLLPVLLTAVAIAVGSILIIVLADDGASAASSSASSSQTADTGAGAAVKVDISDFKFAPATVTVKAGSKVSWVNHDSAPHTATSGHDFDTGTLKQGDTKTVTLDKPGTYTYICQFHAFMNGKVVVK